MTDHREWDELAAGYALHALAPEEESGFQDHLAGCDRCRTSVDEHAFTASQLGSLATPEPSSGPPPWSAIRDAVIRDENEPVRLAERRHRYHGSRRLLAAAAAVAVLAGGGVLGWRLSAGSSGTTSVASCRTSAGCHVVPLHTTTGQTTQASLLVDGSTVRMMPTGIAAAPHGRTYVLWQVVRDGRPTPITRFTAGGSTAASGRLTVSYSDVTEFAVSEEPSDVPLSRPSQVLMVGVTA